MDKETQARIESAPDKILVEITEEDIDVSAESRWHIVSNPISFALSKAGYTEASISPFNAFIGREGQMVTYRPDLDTTAQIDNVRRGERMTPFIACFKKEISRK